MKIIIEFSSGADPGFSERGVRKFKERSSYGVQPQKLFGFVLLNIKITHFEHMFKQISNQVSVATLHDISKINHRLGFQG